LEEYKCNSSQSTKLAQVRQLTASKNQLGPVNFHDFCNTVLTKILKILEVTANKSEK
jgi:hypothetical protein